ncbi:hypothetical protein [Bradyrhizobium iriomotense]|uniref:hypothetical protein n=1 Tax=Bradyrhizobium iriomotense TaxID=441950 RepID=UPI001B89FF73|nr:hypothetical protein [Bradyrhizobium iriomotense]MBR0786930.1 hypothetical protein [Bradyrhizobium iriomotense]
MDPTKRPWADDGEPSADAIFAAVGKALSRWELLESAVAGLFTVITVGNYYAPTSPMLQAYSAIAGSDSRIRMVRAALESWLLTWPLCPLGPNATDLLKQCGRWAGRRNDIAHGIADIWFDDAHWYLFPGLYAGKGRTVLANPEQGKPLIHRPDYRYNAEIIEAFADQFLSLYNRMNETTSALGEWYRIAHDGQR